MTHIEIEENPSVTFIPAESVEESKRVYMPSLNSGQTFIPSFATKWTIEIDAG
ncbi:MAG: hypothetical protein MJ200_02440 [Mycoplasmoidaceae bacterium]|nr:hypothetical protein [Mycoplasmoidaceae bacterium]